MMADVTDDQGKDDRKMYSVSMIGKNKARLDSV